MGSTPSVPRVDIEDVTAALGEVLGVADETLDTDTPLIELGLESFTAVRLRRRLREDFGLELPLAAFLGAATISSVAHGITDPGTGDQERNGDPGDGSFPLTPIQSAYWVGRDPAFPLGGVATFFYREYDRVPAQRAEDDLANLSEAWNRLVLRHPMLRMVVGPDARQRVLDSVPRYEIAVTDLRNRTIDAAEREAEELRHAWSHQVRPADTWPLFDLRAVLLPDGRTRLCLGIDVLAVDFAGWLHLLAEWGTVAADPAAELPGQATTFADIVRQRASDPGERARRDADLAYWTSRVPTLPPEPALPLAADVTELRGHRFTRTAERLSPDEWKALRARAADHGLSPTGVLLAAFGLTLHRWGATDPFCLNVTLFDRPDEPEAAGVVGDFTSTVLVELPDTDPAGWAGFAEYATRANRRFWTDLEHRSVSGMEALRAAGHVDTTPRYPVVFTSGLGLSDGDDPAGWLGEEVFGISQTPQVLLDHIVYPEAGGLTLCWDSVEGAFADGFVDGMLTAHTRLLRTLASEPAAWTDTTLGWNPSYHADEPLDVEPFGDVGPLLPDPWHAAAERHPDRPALLGDTGAWSHRELRVSAARLGSVLTGYGVGPGDLVAVSAEKGPEQVVAILGVSASGAGYVPVEPSWPAGRVASVCEQAGIRHAVLGADVTVEWPAEITRHRLASDGTIAGEPSEVPPTTPEPGELAYVIFTSGSTGKY